MVAQAAQAARGRQSTDLELSRKVLVEVLLEYSWPVALCTRVAGQRVEGSVSQLRGRRRDLAAHLGAEPLEGRQLRSNGRP